MNLRLGFILILIVLGAGWGITQPLAKLAVSTGYRAPGLVFWQFVVGIIVLGAITFAQGKRLPWGRAQIGLYVMVAFIGTILPNSASYEAIRHVPSGLLSILLSTVPMLAFPVALMLGVDRFSLIRLAGLACGLAGVLLIVAPEASLPDRAMLVFVPLALIAPLFYALEGNLLAKLGMQGLDAVQLLLGASVIGAVVSAPIALATGTFISPLPPYSIADFSLVASGVVHGLVYATYFWLVARAGPVFAVQVSYLVTGFGVFWAKLILDESYSVWIWAAMALMFVGVFLVQPRPNASVDSESGKSHA
ncbi:MAG: DMT family transporter [Dinoroseobacter sp.]|nr:DMT family transporter [Dinoroseobacter sp.]